MRGRRPIRPHGSSTRRSRRPCWPLVLRWAQRTANSSGTAAATAPPTATAAAHQHDAPTPGCMPTAANLEADPRRDPVPDQPRTDEPRRAPAAPERAARAGRPGHTAESMAFDDYFEHVGPRGQTPLARMRAVGYISSSHMRLRSRREHRLGHALAGHPARDRRRLDGLARAPREHPRPRATAKPVSASRRTRPARSRTASPAPSTRRTSAWSSPADCSLQIALKREFLIEAGLTSANTGIPFRRRWRKSAFQSRRSNDIRDRLEGTSQWLAGIAASRHSP